MKGGLQDFLKKSLKQYLEELLGISLEEFPAEFLVIFLEDSRIIIPEAISEVIPGKFFERNIENKT